MPGSFSVSFLCSRPLQVEHLDGHEVDNEKETFTKPMHVVKLPGEGMPVNNFPSDFGMLRVKVGDEGAREAACSFRCQFHAP